MSTAQTSLRLAVQTECDATSADFVLHGNFTRSDALDFLVVKSRQLLLYTCVTSIDSSSKSEPDSEAVADLDGANVSFVCQLDYYGTAKAVKVLKDAVFYDYRVTSIKTQDDDIVEPTARFVSAAIICFDGGRLVTLAYDPVVNNFVTLSLHALTQEYSDVRKCEFDYFLQFHIAVYNSAEWHATGAVHEGDGVYLTYSKQYIIVLCHDEKILHVLGLQSTFKRPFRRKEYVNEAIFNRHHGMTTNESDLDNLHMLQVPWLHVSQYYTIDVDAKYGFSDGRYFVRGLVFAPNLPVVGLLVATMPETIATHAMYNDDAEGSIGAKSLLCIKFLENKMSHTLVHRVDGLPLEVADLYTISIGDYLAFAMTSRDFLLWVNLMDPLIYFQFTMCSAVLNFTVESNYDKKNNFRFVDACYLDADLVETHALVTTTSNGFLALAPKNCGNLYLGKVLQSATFGIVNILWFKVDNYNWNVSACLGLDMHDGVALALSGSCTDFALVAVNLDKSILEFNFDFDDAVEAPHVIHLPDLHMSIPCQSLSALESFQQVTKATKATTTILVHARNHGVIREAKNISRVTLGANKTVRKQQQTKSLATDHEATRISHIIGVCDESRIVLAMPKVTLEPFIKLQTSPESVLKLTGIDFDSRHLVTWPDGGTGLLTLLNGVIFEFKCPILPCLELDDDNDGDVHAQDTDSSDILYNSTSVAFGILPNQIYVQVTENDVLFLQGPDLVLKSRETLAREDVKIVHAQVVDVHLIILQSDAICKVYECRFSPKSVKLELLGETHSIILASAVTMNGDAHGLSKVLLTLVTESDELLCFKLPELTVEFTIDDLKGVHGNLYTKKNGASGTEFTRGKKRIKAGAPQQDKPCSDASKVEIERLVAARESTCVTDEIVDVRLVQLNKDDDAPNVIIFMTSRPLLLYQGYWVGHTLCFKLVHHKFTRALPPLKITNAKYTLATTSRCQTSSGEDFGDVLITYPALKFGIDGSWQTDGDGLAHKSIYAQVGYEPLLLRLASRNGRLFLHELAMEPVNADASNEDFGVITSAICFKSPMDSLYLVTTSGGTLFFCFQPLNLYRIKATSCEANRECNGNRDDVNCSFYTTERLDGVVKYTLGNVLERNGSNICYSGDLATISTNLGQYSATIMAVSHQDYYLYANHQVQTCLQAQSSMSGPHLKGKLVALVVREPRNARAELFDVFDQRINFQLKQLATENLPAGTKPLDLIMPNRQIGLALLTIDALESLHKGNLTEKQELVLVFHSANLKKWLACYKLESMTSALSITFNIFGNREYLCLGTCTNLGEHVEATGDVILVDLQTIFARQDVATQTIEEPWDNATQISPREPIVELSQYTKKTFAGPITFMSSLNMGFDLLPLPNFDLEEDVAKLADESAQHKNWVLGHFKPNVDTLVHSVGQRLFVHELSGREFVRGAFVEVPQCITSACIFDKYIIAGDLNRGIAFFMYRYDSTSDSRTICKISGCSTRVDLSIVACAPLVNSSELGILASDYHGNLMLFGSAGTTLDISAAMRLPNRIVQFSRAACNRFSLNKPIKMMGWSSSGCVYKLWMPTKAQYNVYLNLYNKLETLIPPPLATPWKLSDKPQWTPKTQSTTCNVSQGILLDSIRNIGFLPASIIAKLQPIDLVKLSSEFSE